MWGSRGWRKRTREVTQFFFCFVFRQQQMMDWDTIDDWRKPGAAAAAATASFFLHTRCKLHPTDPFTILEPFGPKKNYERVGRALLYLWPCLTWSWCVWNGKRKLLIFRHNSGGKRRLNQAPSLWMTKKKKRPLPTWSRTRKRLCSSRL